MLIFFRTFNIVVYYEKQLELKKNSFSTEVGDMFVNELEERILVFAAPLKWQPVCGAHTAHSLPAGLIFRLVHEKPMNGDDRIE